MTKEAKVTTSNADVLINATEVASVESQNENNMNEVTNTDCCPKEKTTVIAIIDGVKQEVKLARTIYSMDVLKKSQLTKVSCLMRYFTFPTPKSSARQGFPSTTVRGKKFLKMRRMCLCLLRQEQTIGGSVSMPY